MKTIKTILQPYPETRVQWVDKSQGTFSIRTPWILVSGSVDEEHLHSIDQALNAINSFDTSFNQEMLANYFLGQFCEYPVSHVKPRKLNQYVDEKPAPLDCDVSRLDDFANQALRFKTLIWNVEDILHLSRLEGESDLYDGISIITAIRRLRLLSTSSNIGIQQSISRLLEEKNSDTKEYIVKMQRLLEHSLYITQNAVNILQESLGRHRHADELLQSFISSETGHDLLVQKSLKVFGGPRKNWNNALLDEVKMIMDVLRYAGKSSLLALSALIEGFEGVKYDSEPNNIWNMLDNIPGFAKASTGVREHQRINDQHDHSNICLELASVLPPITREEAVITILLSEIAEIFRQSLFEKLYNSVGRV
ncbi:MAG: hypothetical protein WCI18_04065 [Pseudomonadota bacterium]